MPFELRIVYFTSYSILMNSRIYAIVLLLFTGNICFSQTHEIDSLQILLQQSYDDTSKVIILNRLAFRYHRIAPDTSLLYANNAMALAQNINYQKGIGSSYNSLGFVAYSHSEFNTAIDHYQNFLKIMQLIEYPRGIHKAFNNLGIVYKNTGNYPKALEYYQKSLETLKMINSTEDLGGTLNNIGLVYHAMGDYTQSLRYYLESIEAKIKSGDVSKLSSSHSGIGAIKLILGDYEGAKKYFNQSLNYNLANNSKRGIALDYQNLGKLYQKTDSIENAFFYLNKSLLIYQELNNPVGVSDIYNEIGQLQLQENKLVKALKNFNKALSIKMTIQEPEGISKSHLNLARVNNLKNEYHQALSNGTMSLEIAQKIGNKNAIVEASELLYLTYMHLDDNSNAFKYLLIHKNYSDSLLNELKVKEIATIESKYELDNITRENELLLKENELKRAQLAKSEAKLETQRIILVFSIFALLIAIIATYIIYNLYIAKNKANNLLVQLNNEITSQKSEIEHQAKALVEANDKIILINESLESTIEERTNRIKLQNTKLRAYGFSNSHKVRAPLARLMGLVNLSNNNNITSEERIKINMMVSDSAAELDEIIRNLSDVLNQDNT